MQILTPYKVIFQIDAFKETRIPLKPVDAKAVRACPFNSGVYIVFCNELPQYVGESGNVAKRFIAGVRQKKKGYV